MPHERFFLQDLALVLCVAALTTVLFRRLKQPVVLGYLLAGLIVGPATPFPLFADPERITALSELGVVLVMFSIGLEFSLRRLAHVFPRAGLVGIVSFFGVVGLGSLAARGLGFGARESLCIGAMLAFSSTMVIAKLFSEQRVGGPLAELVFGVAVVQDLGAVLLLALSGVLASEADRALEASLGEGARLAAFLGALVVAGYLFVPRALRSIARQRSPETLLVSSVGLCFGLAFLAQWAGYSVALGAFVAGALVAESGKQRQVEPLVRPLRDLFAAVFFVAVGMMVQPQVLVEHGLTILVLVGVVLVGQVASVSFGAVLSGHTPSTALRAGFALANIGEFSFILAGALVAARVLAPELLSVAVSVSVVTVFAAPWCIRHSERLAFALEHRLPRPLRTVATLYGAWLERERAALSAEGRRYRLLRLGGLVALDAACFAAVVIATSLSHGHVERVLVEAGLAAGVARAGVLLGAALFAAPFMVGIARLSAALGAEVAAGALPAPGAGGDGAAIPRRVLVVTLQLALFALLAGPLFALTQPFVPIGWEAGVLGLGFVVLAWRCWRNAESLEDHVRTGARMVIETLRRQNEERGPAQAPAPALEGLGDELQGLGEVVTLRLESSSPALGKTLAELDLRAHTGASVIAITRAEGGVVAPTGQEVLRERDVLALTGTQAALAAARLALTAAAIPRRGRARARKR